MGHINLKNKLITELSEAIGFKPGIVLFYEDLPKLSGVDLFRLYGDYDIYIVIILNIKYATVANLINAHGSKLCGKP